jgi:hypothetical protein
MDLFLRKRSHLKHGEGFNHDSASKTYQRTLLCPVLSVRTGITKELLSPEANTGLVHIHSTDHHVILAHIL